MKNLIIIAILLTCFSFASYSQDTTAANKPKATYQIGAVKITVWENEGKNGKWKNFKVEKVYKKNDKWETTNSFNENDLLELKAAIDKAIANEMVKVQTTEDKK